MVLGIKAGDSVGGGNSDLESRILVEQDLTLKSMEVVEGA